MYEQLMIGDLFSLQLDVTSDTNAALYSLIAACDGVTIRHRFMRVCV
jgi:hypothetical protein